MDEFDVWNEFKKKINKEDIKHKPYPHEGEVWMCSLGKNIGFEQNGGGNNFSRPILIVKKFTNQMFWGIPLSTKQKNLDFYYNFTDLNNQKVSAILAQLKLISVKRLKRNLYEISKEDLKEIKIRLQKFLT